MSLVSAVTGDETRESGVEHTGQNAGRSSVYQSGGKPLSKEALYRAKLKYGVFQTPAQSLRGGVVDAKSASDVAANYANSNKPTVEAYKRLLHPNASKAASAVSTPKKAIPVQEHTQTQTKSLSAAASSAALAAPKTAARSRASSNAASGGAPDSSPAHSKIPKMDITKVLAGAERNAAESVYLRTNPEKVSYVRGISDRSVGKAADASFSLTSDIVANLPTKAEYIRSAEKESHAAEWAQKAADALKDFNPNDITDKNWRIREEERKKMIKHLTSENVLNKARSNAQQRLDTIDRENSYKALYTNHDYNKAAVSVAQQNLQKTRSAAAVNANKVNLGGGLWLAPGDIDNIAKDMIAPVLDEVNQRTGAQRAMDVDIQSRDEAYNQQFSEWVQLQTEKDKNDILLQGKTIQRHEKETADIEATLAKKFNDLCVTKDAEVAQLLKTLEAKKAEFAKLKEDAANQLIKEDERIATECAALEHNNQLAFEDAKVEQDKALEPFKNELQAAEQRHLELHDQKTEVENNIEELRASIQKHSERVGELNTQIEEHDQKLNEENEALETLNNNHSELKSDIENNFILLAEKAKEEAKISSEEARVRQLEIDALINERQTELSNTEIQVNKEKLNLINSLRDVAELKNEDKIDEEKAKAFLGTTSKDFIASQKKSAAPKATAPSVDDTPKSSGKDAKVTAVAGEISSTADNKSLTKHHTIGEIVSPLKSKVKRGSSIKKFFGLKQSQDANAGTAAVPAAETSKPEKKGAIPEHKAEQPVSKSAKDGDKLQPTFSGFSQGSVERDSGKEPKDNRQSLFKEVF